MDNASARGAHFALPLLGAALVEVCTSLFFWAACAVAENPTGQTQNLCDAGIRWLPLVGLLALFAGAREARRIDELRPLWIAAGIATGLALVPWVALVVMG